MGRKKQVKTIDWLIKNYIDFFQEFGMEEDNIRKYYAEWKLKFGERIEDFLWHIFNHLLQENATQSQDIKGFYKRSWLIYSEMVRFRRKHEGKKENELWEQAVKNKLAMTYEQATIELDAFVIGAPECEALQEIKDIKLPIGEMVKKDIIPYNKCTRERGCVCFYSCLGRKDSQGRYISRE